MLTSQVLIIGGGASGLSAGIAAARLGAAVTVLEAGTRVGRKILASGNGRCNLSNVAITPDAYNRPDFVEPLLARYPCESILEFFGTMGVLTVPDAEGRVYPATNTAASVLDALRLECLRLGVDVRCGFSAVRVDHPGSPAVFEVFSEEGESARGESVVVATGGGSLLAGLGHTMTETSPVLGPLRTETEPIRGLSGVRVRCAATLLDAGGKPVITERGELLFRDYGVSGIMIFDLSRYAEPSSVLSIDFFPDLEPAELSEAVERRTRELGWRTAETFFTGMLHDRVARAILRAAGVRSHTPAEMLPHARLATLLKDFRLRVTGPGEAKQAQVTRGGASLEEFDPLTMASVRVDGLFAAGEVLDIDGRSGGYNLHWAWASGITAGEEAARFAGRGATQGSAGSRGAE